MDDDSVFSEEYSPGTETSPVITEIPLEAEAGELAPEVDIEDEIYGVGKPRRIVIRAAITHDQD